MGVAVGRRVMVGAGDGEAVKVGDGFWVAVEVAGATGRAAGIKVGRVEIESTTCLVGDSTVFTLAAWLRPQALITVSPINRNTHRAIG